MRIVHLWFDLFGTKILVEKIHLDLYESHAILLSNFWSKYHIGHAIRLTLSYNFMISVFFVYSWFENIQNCIKNMSHLNQKGHKRCTRSFSLGSFVCSEINTRSCSMSITFCERGITWGITKLRVDLYVESTATQQCFGCALLFSFWMQIALENDWVSVLCAVSKSSWDHRPVNMAGFCFFLSFRLLFLTCCFAKSWLWISRYFNCLASFSYPCYLCILFWEGVCTSWLSFWSCFPDRFVLLRWRSQKTFKRWPCHPCSAAC